MTDRHEPPALSSHEVCQQLAMLLEQAVAGGHARAAAAIIEEVDAAGLDSRDASEILQNRGEGELSPARETPSSGSALLTRFCNADRPPSPLSSKDMARYEALQTYLHTILRSNLPDNVKDEVCESLHTDAQGAVGNENFVPVAAIISAIRSSGVPADLRASLLTRLETHNIKGNEVAARLVGMYLQDLDWLVAVTTRISGGWGVA